MTKNEEKLLRRCRDVGSIDDVRTLVREALRLGIGSEKQGPKVYRGKYNFETPKYTKWYTRKHAAKNAAGKVVTYATIEIDEE